MGPIEVVVAQMGESREDATGSTTTFTESLRCGANEV